METGEDSNQDRKKFFIKLLFILVVIIPSLIIHRGLFYFIYQFLIKWYGWRRDIREFWSIEDQNLISYDRQEENDKQNFIDMFKDKHSYLNANSIAESENLSRKEQHWCCVWILLFIKRISWNIRKSNKNYIDFLKEELESIQIIRSMNIIILDLKYTKLLGKSSKKIRSV